jgi:UDP-2-acetamido-2,6-beta-L-arabino-hexul-4-ose reductase
MNVLIEPIELRQDLRGFVFNPLSTPALKGQKSCHVAMTEPGCVRGNHYHTRATETLAIIGPWLIRYRENGKTTDLSIAAGEVVRMTFPPGVAHAFKNTGSSAGALVVFSDVDNDAASTDLVRDILIEP